MSVYIKGMEMPESCSLCQLKTVVGLDREKCLVSGIEFHSWDAGWGAEQRRHESCPLIPVPEREQILRVLKTERECVTRDCDRECGKCDLSLERKEIEGVYDALIAMFDPADKEGEG